jgi:DNA repair exonuclease SbcCD nuclease subunit
MAYLPYIHDNDEFIRIANELHQHSHTLICHATFDGAEYENGFYAPDGIDQYKLNYKCIISGHVHKQADLGKVWYPGTPRWLTSSDANEEKGIWIVEHTESEDPGFEATIRSTYNICMPIVNIQWTEGEPEPTLPERANTSIELIGSSSFVNRGKELFKGKAKLKTKITDRVVRENRKASASVLDFLDNVYKTGVNKDKLKTYLKEKNYV